MAGGRLNMVVFMAMVVATLLSGAQSVEHVVGGPIGWVVPPGGAVVYSTWASNQTFTVGDVLVFNFANGTHDVANVTKAAYDSCDSNNTSNLLTISPARVTLSAAGEHFFLCTFPRHCSLGQKLAINVTATTTAPTPSPTPTASPPSPTASPPSPTPTPTASPPSPTASPPSPTSSPPSPTASPPTPTPSSSPPGPTTPSPSGSTPSPSGSTPPPPPPSSSAPSFAVAALPVTLLSVALALMF